MFNCDMAERCIWVSFGDHHGRERMAVGGSCGEIGVAASVVAHVSAKSKTKRAKIHKRKSSEPKRLQENAKQGKGDACGANLFKMDRCMNACCAFVW